MAQKKKIISLDIGSHSAKVAVAAVDGSDVTVSRMESYRLPAGEKPTMDALRPWMEKHGFLNSRAIIALAGKDVIFQPFQLVPADPRTPEQAAAMEVLKFNEMASESMVYDFSEFSLGKEDRRLLLSIARPSLLAAPLALAAAGNIQVEDIVPIPIAVFNGLVGEHGADEKCVLYVDAGHTSTSLGVGFGKQLVFARTFSCGGGIFTAAISDKMEASVAQAENAKHAAGSLKPGTPHAETLLPAAERWYAELNSCLAVFRSLFPSDKSKIDKVVLTGGAAKLDGLQEFLQEKIGAEVCVQQGGGTDISKEIPPEYAVCKGLAYSAAERMGANISLLPENVREDIASRRQRPFWYASAAIAVVILAVSLVSGYFQLKRTQGVLNTRHTDLTARRQLASQIKTVRMKNERINHMAAPLTSLLNSTPVMTAILKTVAENRDADEWITTVCDSESYFDTELYESERGTRTRTASRRKRNTDEGQRAGISSVIIEGFTRNTSLSTVSAMITELKKLDFVQSADLLSDDMMAVLPQENLEDQMNAIRFAIEVKVSEK